MPFSHCQLFSLIEGPVKSSFPTFWLIPSKISSWSSSPLCQYRSTVLSLNHVSIHNKGNKLVSSSKTTESISPIKLPDTGYSPVERILQSFWKQDNSFTELTLLVKFVSYAWLDKTCTDDGHDVANSRDHECNAVWRRILRPLVMYEIEGDLLPAVVLGKIYIISHSRPDEYNLQ